MYVDKIDRCMLDEAQETAVIDDYKFSWCSTSGARLDTFTSISVHSIENEIDKPPKIVAEF